MTAVIAGGALAASGAQMQAVFRNPLADPHIMGVSGGAGLGAAIATMALGTSAAYFTGFTVAVAAFLGAFVAAALVVAVSARFRSVTTLLVFGVMLGFIFSALSSVLQYTAGEESLKLFYSWMAGSFSGCRYFEVALMAGALIIGLILAFSNWPSATARGWISSCSARSTRPFPGPRRGASCSCRCCRPA